MSNPNVKKTVLCCNNNGQNIYGRLFLPTSVEYKNKKLPLLIYSHGFGYAIQLISLEHLAENGIACYCFDFGGGSPRSKSDGDSHNMSVLTQQQELECVLEQISQRSEIDSRQIFLCGNSQGGFVSTLAAIKNCDKVAALFLLCPGFNEADYVKSTFGTNGIPPTFNLINMNIGKRWAEDALSVDVYGMMKSFKKNVFIYHGTDDDIVPVEYSRRAAKSFPSCSLVECESTGHMLTGYESKIEQDIISYIQSQNC